MANARDYSNKYKPVPQDPKVEAPHAGYPGGGKSNPNLKPGKFTKIGGYKRRGEKVFPGRGEQSGAGRS